MAAVVILGFYFGNFHGGLSTENGVWGTFGDYVGGILNPLIAAFAFYLIAKTYELQKTELEETRKLLEDSRDTQDKQLKIAALTTLLKSNLTNISILQSEKSTLLGKFIASDEDKILVSRFNELGYFGRLPESDEYWEEYKELLEEIKGKKGKYYFSIILKVGDVEDEIRVLKGDNERLKNRIEPFLK